jgi:hypothetical protein
VQEDSAVIEVFDKGIQSILIGEKTPMDVAKQVDEVKKRETTQREARAAADHAVN